MGLDNGFTALYPDGSKVAIHDCLKNYHLACLIPCMAERQSPEGERTQELLSHCVRFDDDITVTEMMLNVMECVADWLASGDIFDYPREKYLEIIDEVRQHMSAGAIVVYWENR